MFLPGLFLHLVAFTISYLLMNLSVVHNLKIPFIVKYFNIYGIMAFIPLVFYLKYISGHNVIVYLILLLIITLFFTDRLNIERLKYKHNFRSMLLSFGYNRQGYFNTYLSKKLFAKGLKTFSFSLGIYYFFNILIKYSYTILNWKIILSPIILIFFASLTEILKMEEN